MLVKIWNLMKLCNSFEAWIFSSNNINELQKLSCFYFFADKKPSNSLSIELGSTKCHKIRKTCFYGLAKEEWILFDFIGWFVIDTLLNILNVAVITFLKDSRMHGVFPKPTKITGFPAFNRTNPSTRLISVGNKYQSDWLNASLCKSKWNFRRSVNN